MNPSPDTLRERKRIVRIILRIRSTLEYSAGYSACDKILCRLKSTKRKPVKPTRKRATS